MPYAAYYQLRCEPCNAVFAPMVATKEEELLIPDFERMEQQAGHPITESFREFVAVHAKHGLDCVRG